MRKILLIALVLFIIPFSLMGARPSRDTLCIASGVALAGASAIDTLDFDIPLATRIANSNDLVTYCKLLDFITSAADSTSGCDISFQYSVDNSNWTSNELKVDSLLTDTWQVDSIPAKMKYFKYARLIVEAVTLTSKDATFTSYLVIYKE